MSATTDDAVEVEVQVVRTGRSARPFQVTLPANVWGDALKQMLEDESSAARNAVATDIQNAGYDGAFEDDEEVTIAPTAKNMTALNNVLTTLGLGVDLESLPAADGTAKSAPKAAKAGVCEFSGQPTRGGRFLPGGDMKLKGALLKVVDNIDLGDSDTVSVGEGVSRDNYTWSTAIDKLTSYDKWGYSRSELEDRRRKVAKKRVEAAEAKATAAAEKAKAKTAKEAEAAETESEEAA